MTTDNTVNYAKEFEAELKSAIAERAELLTQVAVELGDGWEYLPESTKSIHGMIHKPSGMTLHINNGPYNKPDTLHIFGSFPLDVRDRHAINVSKNKTPRQIANDINKRLMGEYEPVYEKAVDQKLRNDKFETDRLKVVERLLEANKELQSFKTDKFRLRFYGAEKWRGDLKVHSEDSVSLDLSVSPELAIKIMELLSSDSRTE